MKWTLNLFVLLGLSLAGAVAPALADEEKPVVAMIETGTLASTLGPAIGLAGYPVVYGSRDPGRASVTALVKNTGSTPRPPVRARRPRRRRS